MDCEDCETCGHEVDWIKYDYCPHCEAGAPPIDEIEAERNTV